MRLIFRLMGTWFLGAALVLIIVDGTKTLAANALVMTSLADGWQVIHAQSYVFMVEMAEQNGQSWMWDIASTTLLSWPAWAVIGVPGILFAIIGRTAASRAHSYDHV